MPVAGGYDIPPHLAACCGHEIHIHSDDGDNDVKKILFGDLDVLHQSHFIAVELDL